MVTYDSLPSIDHVIKSAHNKNLNFKACSQVGGDRSNNKNKTKKNKKLSKKRKSKSRKQKSKKKIGGEYTIERTAGDSVPTGKQAVPDTIEFVNDWYQGGTTILNESNSNLHVNSNIDALSPISTKSFNEWAIYSTTV